MYNQAPAVGQVSIAALGVAMATSMVCPLFQIALVFSWFEKMLEANLQAEIESCAKEKPNTSDTTQQREKL